MDTLGNRIKDLRKKYNMTQGELGDKVGLHGSNISRIEKNQVSPTANVLFGFSQIFSVTTDWLITGSTSPLNNHSTENPQLKINIADTIEELSLDEVDLLKFFIKQQSEKRSALANSTHPQNDTSNSSNKGIA